MKDEIKEMEQIVHSLFKNTPTSSIREIIKNKPDSLIKEITIQYCMDRENQEKSES